MSPYSKEDIANAKKRGWPVMIMGIDGRHLPKESPARCGGILRVGPLSPELAKEFEEFLLSIIKRCA